MEKWLQPANAAQMTNSEEKRMCFLSKKNLTAIVCTPSTNCNHLKYYAVFNFLEVLNY